MHPTSNLYAPSGSYHTQVRAGLHDTSEGSCAAYSVQQAWLLRKGGLYGCSCSDAGRRRRRQEPQTGPHRIAHNCAVFVPGFAVLMHDGPSLSAVIACLTFNGSSGNTLTLTRPPLSAVAISLRGHVIFKGLLWQARLSDRCTQHRPDPKHLETEHMPMTAACLAPRRRTRQVGQPEQMPEGTQTQSTERAHCEPRPAVLIIKAGKQAGRQAGRQAGWILCS
jgi:hypothetical protein